jgi:hypothetical protein
VQAEVDDLPRWGATGMLTPSCEPNASDHAPPAIATLPADTVSPPTTTPVTVSPSRISRSTPP